MRLSIDKRNRLVSLYYKHSLHIGSQRLCELAAKEDIFISTRGASDLIRKWNETGSTSNRPSPNRALAKKKITEYGIQRIDTALFRNRQITARVVKQNFQLRPSNRTIKKYVKRLGRRKTRTKSVSVINRVERLVYARLCILFEENFDHKIFIGESTSQSNRNAATIWYKPFLDDTRLGLVGKHLKAFGAISRQGASQLLIFDGKLNKAGLKEVCNRVWCHLYTTNTPNIMNFTWTMNLSIQLWALIHIFKKLIFITFLPLLNRPT
jgi:hypothetical protein